MYMYITCTCRPDVLDVGVLFCFLLNLFVHVVCVFYLILAKKQK